MGAAQATGDACDDERNIAGAEPPQTGGRVGGGVVTLEGGGEFLAVIDEPADEREEAADAAGLVRGGGFGFGLRGRVGDGRCGGHEQNRNTGPQAASRNNFRARRHGVPVRSMVRHLIRSSSPTYRRASILPLRIDPVAANQGAGLSSKVA